MSDEVDALIEAWRAQRGDLELEPMHIWSRIDRLGRLLADRRKAAFQSHDIEGWEFDVLAALRRAGEPHTLTPGQLLKETFVTSGTMTNRLDQLEKAGLIERSHNPDDRRGVIIALTQKGFALVDEAVTAHVENEHRLLEGLNTEERAALDGLLRKFLREFE